MAAAAPGGSFHIVGLGSPLLRTLALCDVEALSIMVERDGVAAFVGITGPEIQVVESWLKIKMYEHVAAGDIASWHRAALCWLI